MIKRRAKMKVLGHVEGFGTLFQVEGGETRQKEYNRSFWIGSKRSTFATGWRAVGYMEMRGGCDTIPTRGCRMHRVCCMIVFSCAYADLADDEMFAYTRF